MNVWSVEMLALAHELDRLDLYNCINIINMIIAIGPASN